MIDFRSYSISYSLPILGSPRECLQPSPWEYQQPQPSPPKSRGLICKYSHWNAASQQDEPLLCKLWQNPPARQTLCEEHQTGHEGRSGARAKVHDHWHASLGHAEEGGGGLVGEVHQGGVGSWRTNLSFFEDIFNLSSGCKLNITGCYAFFMLI